MFEKLFIIIGSILIIIPFVKSRKYGVLFLIENQLKNFSDFENDKILWDELIGYFIGPLLLTVGISFYGINLTTDGLSILLNIISITSGLLISSLIGINSIKPEERTVKLVLITSKYIVFSIFITIVIFLLSVPEIFKFNIPFIELVFNQFKILYKVKNGIIFYLFILYVLNIFLILKKLIQIFIKHP